MRPFPRWLASVCALLPLTLGCSGSSPPAKGELILSIQTDMSIPKDIDQVRLEVLVYGNTLFANDYEVGPAGLKIPATIALVAGKDPGTPITIRVLARQKAVVRTLREVITTVPTDRVALLRIPIQWLCDGEVSEPSAGQVQSTCPEQQTCVAGRCQPSQLDLMTFPDYAPEQVFGGAPAPDLSGQCLDTLGCFAQGYVASVNRADCTIARPLGGVGLNVALVNGPQSDGICGPSSCLIPLDADDANGWTEENGRIQLPLAVCDRLSQGRILGVAVTTACATKTASIPTCGPWSSVQGTTSLDAGAPDGLSGDSSDDAPQDSFAEASADTAPEALPDQLSEEPPADQQSEPPPPECVLAQDCTGQDTECAQRACNAGHCEIVYVPSGQALAQQSPGNCMRRECDGLGQQVDVVDDSDIPIDGRQCTEDVCTHGSPSNPNLNPGQDCSEGGGQLCNDSGQCVQCLVDSNCASGVCQDYQCAAASCGDSVQNGDETGTDCGGSCPQKCADGLGCTAGIDCQSHSCQGHICQPPSCSDSVLNGSETGPDCGGPCPQRCANGLGCLTGIDCQSHVCQSLICQAPSCLDATQNGDETSVDCGGSCPQKCADGLGCLTGSDCQSLVCDGHSCQAPSCSDGVSNGPETGLDCGGPCSPNCSCRYGLQCTSSDCCQASMIEGGTFLMGRSPRDSGADYYYQGRSNELPEHSAHVEPYALDTFEVTVGRFREFLHQYPPRSLVQGAGANPKVPESGWREQWNAFLIPSADRLIETLHAQCPENLNWTDEPLENERFPMNCITWYEAFAFCVWDNGRLPTEAEWEFAAANGAQNRLFPWGNQTWPNPSLADFAESDQSPAMAVGSYPEGHGAFGLLDLGGSMWEFTLDSYAEQWYSDQGNPCMDCCNVNPEPTKALRGGSWRSVASDLRSVVRWELDPTTRSDQVSMRCARAPETVPSPYRGK